VEPVPEHPVPAGPLAARWLGYEVGAQRAGVTTAARAELENAGSATWAAGPYEGVNVGYHWLDPLGNPIVWAGTFTPLADPVPPGDRVTVEFTITAPIPPGNYRLALDLVADGRCWFAEVGNQPLELAQEVLPRLAERSLAVRLRGASGHDAGATREALAAQEEPITESGSAAATAYLAAGCLPPPDWSRRILDAHAEGYAAVGGSIEPTGSVLTRRRARQQLAPWAPGTGRKPGFSHPLVCPSLVAGVEPTWTEDVCGLPALTPPAEPWLFDGRIVLRVRA
jgi:hypothetical protein